MVKQEQTSNPFSKPSNAREAAAMRSEKTPRAMPGQLPPLPEGPARLPRGHSSLALLKPLPARVAPAGAEAVTDAASVQPHQREHAGDAAAVAHDEGAPAHEAGEAGPPEQRLQEAVVVAVRAMPEDAPPKPHSWAASRKLKLAGAAAVCLAAVAVGVVGGLLTGSSGARQATAPTPANENSSDGGAPATTPAPSTSCTMEQVSTHIRAEDCWVVVHGVVLDATVFRTRHPGGPEKIACGTDLTSQFQRMHGPRSNLDSKIEANAELKAVCTLVEASPPVFSSSATVASALDPTTYDFSSHVKRQHPGTGNEFKTLVYIELKGAWDGASGFVNVKNENEVHLWCSKRPTLSALDYCECVTTETGICTKYKLKTGSEQKVFELQNTDGHLAMTDLFASGTTGWLQLWNDTDMAVVPGVGRYDHARSHFEVKDAAAKGVSVEEEKHTSNGWLGKSIFGEKKEQVFCQFLCTKVSRIQAVVM